MFVKWPAYVFIVALASLVASTLPSCSVHPVIDVGRSRDAAAPGSPPGPAGSVTVRGLDPATGPPGTIVTLFGGGFRAGDRVEVAGAGFGPVLVPIRTLGDDAVTAAIPTNASASSLRVRLVSGEVALPSGGLPFTLVGGHAYFVAPGGNDGNPGTIDAPFRTIQRSMARLVPGDIVYLREGLYQEAVTVGASGAPGAPITVRAFPAEEVGIVNPGNNPNAPDTVLLSGSWLVLDRLHITNLGYPGQGVSIFRGASHDTISNCEIFGSRGQGILIDGDDNLIYKNHIHHNGSTFAHDHGVYVVGRNNTIRSNVIHDNFTYGIQLYNETNIAGGNKVEYNYLYSNGFGSAGQGYRSVSGIVVATGQPNSTIRYNRICGNAQYGLIVGSGVSGTLITGNVSCLNPSGGYSLDEPGAMTFTGNLSYNDRGFALYVKGPVSSDHNNYFVSGGEGPVLVYNANPYSFDEFVRTSGLDAHSNTSDPRFRGLPAHTFDPGAAMTYDFCNDLIDQFCVPPP